MTILKPPPKIKILEALSCIVDNRVEVINDIEYIVKSSDHSRTYNVYVNLSKREVDSTDNGTRIKGYIGYPIIAVLMLRKVLPIDYELAKCLSHIPWRRLNEELKSYEKVMDYVKKVVEERGCSSERIDKYVSQVMSILRRITLKKITKY